MKKLLLICCCCLYYSSKAQLDFAQGFGGQIGFSVNFGSHFNRIGLVAKLFYHYEHIQANVQFCGFYNARSFPTGLPSWEGQMRIGIVGTFGAKNAAHYSPFLNEVSNQTSRPFSIGYSYNFYLDNIETSQLTGTVGLGIYGFSLAFENDFLAFLREDKYRSGALGLYYRIGNTQLGLTNIAWTADPYAKNTITNRSDRFPAKYGYRVMDKVTYSNHSAGILALQIEHSVGFGQYIGASIGIDAEQIRNMVQNKWIHDSFLLTDPHVPMIDSEGKQYWYLEGQKIRTPKFYMQFLGNNTLFY